MGDGLPASRYAPRVGFAIAAVLGLASPGEAQSARQPTPATVTYDHLKDGERRFYSLRLQAGQQFQVKILNTCRQAFVPELVGIERAAAPPALGPPAAPDQPPKVADYVFGPHTHDDRYGGYFVNIRRRTQGATDCQAADGTTADLKDATLVIAVATESWDLAISGGFTFDGLTDPVFALRSLPGETKKQVFEEAAKRDSAKLGIASFIHVFHRAHPWFVPVLGIGIRSDNKTVYYLGLAWRLGDKAAINGGIAAGPIARLPAGTNLTTNPEDRANLVDDANVLNNLSSKTIWRWFFGLSYTFIDVRERVLKPFAGTSSNASGSTPSASVACTYQPSPRTLTLGAAAGSETVLTLKTSPGCGWRIAPSGVDWLGVAPLQGTGEAKVKVVAKTENDTAAPRPAILEITDEKKNKLDEVSVVQERRP